MLRWATRDVQTHPMNSCAIGGGNADERQGTVVRKMAANPRINNVRRRFKFVDEEKALNITGILGRNARVIC